jgi:hypothetical protein
MNSNLTCTRCGTEVKKWHHNEKLFLCVKCKHDKHKERCRSRYSKNQKEAVEYRRNYVKINKKIVNEKQREDYKNNREKYLEYKRIKNKTPEEKQRKRDYARKRYAIRIKTDIQFKLAKSLRNRLKEAVKDNAKSGSAVSDLGCSISEFKIYIESLFKEGMSWDNWGKWHLDHIIPLASVDLTIRDNVLRVCNYKNFQPLWAEDNIKKGCKI